MNSSTCDSHDVSKAASDLIAFCCSTGATQLDSFSQVHLSLIASSLANELISAVDKGIITAGQAIQQIKNEYAELSSKALFYAQNGVGVVAGAMQVEAGVSKIAKTRGVGVFAGAPLIAHGFNNIYEGMGNINNGPGAPSVTGPVREFYQTHFGSVYEGNMAYYATDMYLSTSGLLSLVRKPDSMQLFTRDPINYEMAYKQMGKLALAFEALVDGITINNMLTEGKFSNREINTDNY